MGEVDISGIVNNRPKGLRRARALLEEQLGKAFAENGGNVREAIACGGTALELAREAIDKHGSYEARYCEDPDATLDAAALREVASWCLAAAGLIDAGKAGAR